MVVYPDVFLVNDGWQLTTAEYLSAVYKTF